MKYYVIKVDVYDEENTQSYILDTLLFSDEESAKNYLDSKKDWVKEQHWTAKMDKVLLGNYNIDDRHGYLFISDIFSGQSLEIGTVEVQEPQDENPMTKEFQLPYMVITREDIEIRGYSVAKLTDDDMECIAGSMSKAITEWEADWHNALDSALQNNNVPLIEDELEEEEMED